MEMRTAVLKYSEEIAIKSINRFWIRTLGFLFPVVFVLAVIALIVLIRTGDTNWYVGAFGSVLALTALLLGGVYFYQYKSAVAKYRNLENGQIRFQFNNEGFRLVSGESFNESKWSIVHDVWTYPDAYMIFFAKSQFFTIPVNELATEVKEALHEAISKRSSD